MWGGKLPSTWEPIDAEMYAILAYLRKMARASDAQSRRCLVLCDCKPALQQIENAHRKGMPEGLRDWERGGLLEAIAHYRSRLEAVVFMWVPAHTWEKPATHTPTRWRQHTSEITTRKTPRKWCGMRRELGRACKQ